MSGNSTFFKVDRKIFKSDIWLQPVELRLFIYLIGQARHSEEPCTKYKNKGIVIKQGQYLRSYRKLRDDLEYIENNAIKNYSLSRIKTAIDRLEEQERIKTEKTQLGTLFTVVNYMEYQGRYNKNNEGQNGEKTVSERSENGARTERERSLNNTKNVKNDNNDNNDISIYANEIKEIYDCWIELLSDINNARLTKKQKKTIATKLKKWNKDKILQAIKNYNEIYRSDFYYSHNWTLQKFIKQGNGAPRFVKGLNQKHDGDLWKDYLLENSNNDKKDEKIDQLKELYAEAEQEDKNNNSEVDVL